MKSGRARFVVCIALLAALAIAAGALVNPPEFDLVSGREWAERVTLADEPSQAGLPPSAPPAIASGWILLAGGLIVSVLGLALQARMNGLLVARPNRSARPEVA